MLLKGATLKELLMPPDTLVYVLLYFLCKKIIFFNQHSKISTEPHLDFGIFRSGSEFSRHDTKSRKRENFENSRAMQRDSESTINLNQNTKQINRQASFHSSSNSSSTTAIQDFKAQPNSGNVINEFSGGEADWKQTEKGTKLKGLGESWGVKPTHTLPPATDPSRQKRPLRHLRIAFKLSYLDKTYIRRLKYNLTATNCKRAQKCLRKTFNRRLIKMSTYDVPKTSFKDVSQIDFFKFQKKKTFCFYLLISCFLIFGQNVVTKLSFRRRCYKKKSLKRVYGLGFTTKYQRCSNNVMFMKSFSCIRKEIRDS